MSLSIYHLSGRKIPLESKSPEFNLFILSLVEAILAIVSYYLSCLLLSNLLPINKKTKKNLYQSRDYPRDHDVMDLNRPRLLTAYTYLCLNDGDW